MNGVIGMTGCCWQQIFRRSSGDTPRWCERAARPDSLIDHILDLSKIEAGKMVLETVGFRPARHSGRRSGNAGHPGPSKRTGTHLPGRARHPSLLRGDPGRLRQILVNLAANAVKFTSRGEVALRVELAHDDKRTATIRFTVCRYGNRYPQGPGRRPVLTVRASGWLDYAKVRRHRIGPGHLQAAGGDDGRPDRL